VHVKKKKVGYPTLADVQQAPGHLAFAEGDEGKATMTGMLSVMCDVFAVS
jgi:hypothetical protein